MFGSPSQYLRAWAIQLELEDRAASPDMLSRMAALAKSDPTPWVRLALAAGLQRLPLNDRWPIAAALAQHSEDVGDSNLPLMLWYGVEPLVPADTQRALELALSCRIPVVSQYIARRAGEDAAGLALVVEALGQNKRRGDSGSVARRSDCGVAWSPAGGDARRPGTRLTANCRPVPARRCTVVRWRWR